MQFSSLNVPYIRALWGPNASCEPSIRYCLQHWCTFPAGTLLPTRATAPISAFSENTRFMVSWLTRVCAQQAAQHASDIIVSLFGKLQLESHPIVIEFLWLLK